MVNVKKWCGLNREPETQRRFPNRLIVRRHAVRRFGGPRYGSTRELLSGEILPSPAGEHRNNLPSFLFCHLNPSRDFVPGPTASCANAGRIEFADINAGRSHVHAGNRSQNQNPLVARGPEVGQT